MFLPRCIPPEESPPSCPESCAFRKDHQSDSVWCLSPGDLQYETNLPSGEISSTLIGRAPTMLRSHWSRAPDTERSNYRRS